uniref:C2H2-type domain-containing protein n=1 Tax=Panagrolaimus superbus TaxID=310955 RepID=A0A914Y5L6_9BILA
MESIHHHHHHQQQRQEQDNGIRRVKQEIIDASKNDSFIKPEKEEETYTYDVDFSGNPNEPIITKRSLEDYPEFDSNIPPPQIPLDAYGYPNSSAATPIEELPISHQIVPPPLLSCYAHPANVSVQAPVLGISDFQNQAFLLKKAKMELYNRDLKNLTSRTQLIEYMLKQSSDPIPESDGSLLFNCILSTRQGVIGAQNLAQVSCFANPNLDTYICLLCQYWTTESEMFKHLKSEIHRLTYMQKNKEYHTLHAKVLCQQNSKLRSKMIEECAYKIAEEEGIKKCKTRMRVVLNEIVIAKIWPDYFCYVDDSWQTGNFNDDEIKTEIKPDKESLAKVEVKNEDEYGEAIEAKPNMAKLKARIDLEDGELSDSDEEDDNEDEEAATTKFPSTSSITPLNMLSTADIKPQFAKIDEDQRILTALILIRQEVFDQRTFSRSLIEFICKEAGVTPAEALKFRNIKDVGERIGDETFADTLAPIAEYFHDRKIKEFDIPSTPPAIHSAVLLTQMGIEKQQVAVLLRTLAMHKMDRKASTPPPMTPLVNSIERDKHGSIIHKNYQAEFPYKEYPLSILAPNPDKERHHPYRRPHSSSSTTTNRDRSNHRSSSKRSMNEVHEDSASSVKDEPSASSVKDEPNASSVKDEPNAWDSASDILENILR